MAFCVAKATSLWWIVGSGCGFLGGCPVEIARYRTLVLVGLGFVGRRWIWNGSAWPQLGPLASGGLLVARASCVNERLVSVSDCGEGNDHGSSSRRIGAQQIARASQLKVVMVCADAMSQTLRVWSLEVSQC